MRSEKHGQHNIDATLENDFLEKCGSCNSRGPESVKLVACKKIFDTALLSEAFTFATIPMHENVCSKNRSISSIFVSTDIIGYLRFGAYISLH